MCERVCVKAGARLSRPCCVTRSHVLLYPARKKIIIKFSNAFIFPAMFLSARPVTVAGEETKQLDMYNVGTTAGHVSDKGWTSEGKY